MLPVDLPDIFREKTADPRNERKDGIQIMRKEVS